MNQWNRTAALFGLPHTGKSTLSLRVIRDWQREGRAFALVYEGGGSFPRIGGDGRRLTFVRDVELSQARRRISEALASGTAPESVIWVVRVREPYAATREDGVSDESGGGLEVAHLAAELSCELGRNAVCWFDEINNVDGGCAGFAFSKWLRSALGNRRHLRLAIGYSSQSPAWPHRHLRRLTNELYCLRVTDARDLECLREMGAPASDLPRISALPDFKYLHYPRLG